MRKVLILFLIAFSLGFYVIQDVAASKIDLKLHDEIGIAFINKNMLLIMDNKDATLLLLGNDNLNNLNKFKYKVLNLMTLKKENIDIKAQNRIILHDVYKEDNITYSLKKGLISINYDKINMCIYLGGEYNINDCQFVYFYNTKVSGITLYDYNEAIFQYNMKPLPSNILEKIYEQSIDIYTLRNDELTVIKIGQGDYEIIVINNE